MNRKAFSRLIPQFLVTFGRRYLEIYSKLLFTEIHPRFFRAETIVILLVDADTAITVSIATGRILEQENDLLFLKRLLSKWEIVEKMKYFSKGAERVRF